MKGGLGQVVPGFGVHKDFRRRFWAKVDKSGGSQACWNWQGSICSNGYGRFMMFAGASRWSHRVAFLLSKGVLPGPPMEVCHACDNPRCCNPNHLFLGTRKDNVADMVRKGRHSHGAAHGRLINGERSGGAKLTWKEVREIRSNRHIRTSDSAHRYGVSADNIRKILQGTTWKEDL